MNPSAFRLPTLGTDAAPAFTTARACRDWLATQPMGDGVQAQALLARQLNLLNRYELAAAERLKILELLRDPIAFAQGEAARRFAGRPLPLAPPEQAGLEANLALWQALQTGYLHCLAGDEDVRPHAALAAQRAIAALRAELADICRAPHDPPARLWRSLHLVYASAERLGAAADRVNDSLQADYPASSVLSAYAQTLLLQRAGPFELSARQLAQVLRWLERWGTKVSALTAPPAAPKIPPLVVDLGADRPEATAPAAGGPLRWLDLESLATGVKKRILRLQRGESPLSLKLGEDCVQPACENLLKRLYLDWFKDGAARRHPRRTAQGHCRLATGFEAIHYHVSGKPFRQPVQGALLSKRQADEIATFGRLTTRHEDDAARNPGYAAEEWRVLDESAAGFRLARPLAQAGARMGGGQLLAVQLAAGGGYRLAATRWARIAQGTELQMGGSIVPGAPLAVAVRGTGLTAAQEKFQPGFLLPAVPAVNEPESVILPAGWFRAGRILELYAEAPGQIRLTGSLERGTDFERVGFVRL